MTEDTPTGIPIIDCHLCGRRHPKTRKHCSTCGSPSMFPHDVHGANYTPFRPDLVDQVVTERL